MEGPSSEPTPTDPFPPLASPNDDETEIEYYSSGDEDDEDSDDSLDDSSSWCEDLHLGGGGDRSNHHHPPMHQEAPHRYQSLPRGASPRGQSSDHQSMTSTDAFSLPVGTQEADDVSSLEENDDPVPVCPRYDYFRTNISDSLKEDEKHAQEDKETETITKFPSPIGVISSPTQEQQLEATAQNTVIPSKAAFLSFPTSLIGRPELVLDDEKDGSVRSIRGVNGFGSSIDKEGSVKEDAEMEDLTERMHRSLFLVPSQASFLYDECTPEHASVRHGMDDLTLKEYAKSFPPELDFEQAQKYLLQLAHGIPDTLGSPRESTSSSGLSHRRITTPGSHSEYTEILMEHDDDDVRIDPHKARTSPNGHGRGVGLPCYSPKESVLSYDYTEIVVESWEDEIMVEEIIEEEEEAY